MASEVDICNTSVGYLGDAANIVAISPPDGSAQAAHCARFYPMARDELLEMHNWGFATRRSSLTLLAGTPPSTWLYQYGVPNKIINAISVLNPTAADDESVNIASFGTGITGPINGSVPAPAPSGIGGYTPQPFVMETLDSGADVIYTNQENAVLRYTVAITDTTQFSALFTAALTWLLASKLAGPILKGDEGRKAAQDCFKAFLTMFGRATESDANQRKELPQAQPVWMQGR